MNITWYSNSSGSWQPFGTNNSVGNGTYYQGFHNASENGKWWYWNVTVNDGEMDNSSDIFSFFTGFESKIHNIGSTNISGYLLMRIDFYNETSEEWVVDLEVVNDTTPRFIDIGEELALDEIFNPCNVSTDDFSNGYGTYRVYVALCDPDGNVLVRYLKPGKTSEEKTYIEDWYEFTATGS